MPHKCYDGSCRAKSENCPALDGCFNPDLPYRCQSGVCAADSNACVDIDKNLKSCDAGLTRCVDGVCRNTCPPHNGCPISKPL